MAEKKYSVKQGFILREIAGEFIAVPVDSSCGNNIVVLNPVSKFLWEEMQSEKTFDELVEAMLREYGIDRKEAETDLKEFLDRLEESGLIN